MQARGDAHVWVAGERGLGALCVIGPDRRAQDGDVQLEGTRCHLARVRHAVEVAVRVHESPWVRRPVRVASPGHARPPRLPANAPFCAASCIARAAETSSPAPSPDMCRRTSPAIIWPMMGGMKLAVPRSVRSERAAPGAAAMRTGSSQE